LLRIMDPNKLTEKAQEAVLAAQRLAEEAHNPQLDPEHLLLALVRQHEGLVPQLLERLNVNVPALRAELESQLAKLSKQYGGQLRASGRFNQLFNAAKDEAQRLKDEYVSTEHFLIA